MILLVLPVVILQKEKLVSCKSERLCKKVTSEAGNEESCGSSEGAICFHVWDSTQCKYNCCPGAPALRFMAVEKRRLYYQKECGRLHKIGWSTNRELHNNKMPNISFFAITFGSAICNGHSFTIKPPMDIAAFFLTDR